jgi:hypothetical protein
VEETDMAMVEVMAMGIMEDSRENVSGTGRKAPMDHRLLMC